MGAHQDHPAGRARVDAVAIVIGHHQAGRARPDRLLDEPVEGAAKPHQARALVLEYLPDRSILELRMRDPFGVGDALVLQPRIQLGQALHPRLGPEKLVPQIADLVLDLAFLPTRSGSAGHRFDQMVRAHLQKAAIVPARLADEDRLDRGLHVVVDAAPADPAVELKRLVMGVEHQFLGLAKIYSDERHTAVRQLHVRRLDRQRESLERDRLVAPVELVGFPWLEAHRHISMGGNSGPFLTPELCEAMHAVVRAVISAPTKLFEQPLRRTALPLRQLGFRLENLRQRIDPNAKLRRRLNVPSVFELGSEASDHLANRRPRHRKRPHDLLDRVTLFEIGAPYLADLVHAKHPHPSFPADQAQRKNAHKQVRRGRYWTRKQPFRGSLLQAILHRYRVNAPSDARTARPCGRATDRGRHRACAPRPSRNPTPAGRPWRSCRTIRDAAAIRCRVRSTGRRPALAERDPNAFSSDSPAAARPRTGRVAARATTGPPTNKRPTAADDAGAFRTGAAAPPRRRPPTPPRHDPRGTRPASWGLRRLYRTPRPPCATPPPATS